jgi:hypothetical protein
MTDLTKVVPSCTYDRNRVGRSGSGCGCERYGDVRQLTAPLEYGCEVAERSHMSKIVRYRFMGSWWWFWLLCVSGIGLPLAVLYLLTGTVRMDTDVDEPEQIAEDLYSGKLAGKQ